MNSDTFSLIYLLKAMDSWCLSFYELKILQRTMKLSFRWKDGFKVTLDRANFTMEFKNQLTNTCSWTSHTHTQFIIYHLNTICQLKDHRSFSYQNLLKWQNSWQCWQLYAKLPKTNICIHIRNTEIHSDLKQRRAKHIKI